jgi:hypothetical protein
VSEVIPKAWLGKRVTIAQAEYQSLQDIEEMHRQFPGIDIPRVPFGLENEAWQKFRAELLPGDALYEFNSPPELWDKGQGKVGFVAYRAGVLVSSMISGASEQAS